jgi:uncharacterized membrane protein YbhN (UPF0104 family)
VNTRSLPRTPAAPPRSRQAPPPAPLRHQTGRPWWPWVTRGLTLAFFMVVAVFAIRYARSVDWRQVRDALADMPGPVLALALGLAVASHLLYSTFDLLGRRYTGHGLPVHQVMQVNFISYAFNLNMGSLVGGVGFRLRLYSRLGLDNGTITRVITLSMLTNWLGYLLLAGAVFLFAPLPLPPEWKMSSTGLQWLGAGLLLLAAVYLVLCVVSKRRSFDIRGHELILPRTRMALLQLAMSSANWLIMGGIIHVLLRGQVAYPAVLSVLLAAAVAGVITHVPAGLGVLEGVFLALLAHQVPESRLLAALLAYRALYYIGPLVVAAVLYLGLELQARRGPRDAQSVPAQAGREP